MLKLNYVMIGSLQPKALAEFYEKVFEKPADWSDGEWYGWQAGGIGITIGPHSEVTGRAKEPQRLILNFETEQVKEEFARIKALGTTVIKDIYEMQGAWIGTFADPDGNYFQVLSPWKGE